MRQAVQHEAADILVEGVNLSQDAHIMNMDAEELAEVKDFKARANACWNCGEYGHFFRDCQAPNKVQMQRDGPMPSTPDEQPIGQIKIGMESQQSMTSPMVDQFIQMILWEKRKTKYAVRKYKDLKEGGDDKRTTTAVPTAPTITVTPVTTATPAALKPTTPKSRPVPRKPGRRPAGAAGQ